MEETLSISTISGFELDDILRGSPNTEEIVTDLYVKLRPSLVGYVYHLIGSARDAEDVVQVAFIQLFDKLQERAEIQNVRGWLYKVVHNLAIDEVRKAGRRRMLFEQWLPDYDETAGGESAEQELINREQIERALSRLNEREQQCLMLRSEGLSYQEIADVLEISAKSVSVYLARGLKKFESTNEK